MILSQFHLLPKIGLMAPPPAGLGGTVLTDFQGLLSLRGAGELQTPLKYSKFADDGVLEQENVLSAKVGFLFVYGPALLIAALLGAFMVKKTLVTTLLCVHFGKRLLETLFLHDFSGSKGMPVEVVLQISPFYALISYMIGANAVAMESTVSGVANVGLALFGVGQVGNLYHHVLLQKLKKERVVQGRRYVPPSGGLFSLVAAPHYLFEITSWIGLALVAQQFNAFLEIPSCVVYLAARAKNCNQLYFDSFTKEEWPRSRKNLVPFLY
jgi:very-long-chain enoyl-CoA reductase